MMTVEKSEKDKIVRRSNYTIEREDNNFIEGKMRYDLEQKELILESYEEAILLAPFAGELYYRKGQVLEQLGRLAEARRAYSQAKHLGW